MKNLKNNIFFKIGIIACLIFVLMIPTTLIQDLIHEREDIQQRATREVSQKWGTGQVVTGPFLSIPYDRYEKQYSPKDSTHKLVKIRNWAHFLPEKLDINGAISPEKRYRGIYEVVVYESKLDISGNFDALDFKALEIDPENVLFEKATLNFGINGLKGIEKQVVVDWNGNKVFFDSGVATNHIVSSGINAVVPLQKKDTEIKYNFETTIDLKGSQFLYFNPVGKTTNVTITSDWQTPSFTGTYLPDERTVSEEGFTSNWNILHLNRNYPQQWKSRNYKINDSEFGTDLLLPVDSYKKSYRVGRYAILFLALTFLTFFFVEVMRKVFIHPIQYLLVGLALVVFYVLLLSFSEHMMFNIAYIISTILTLSLISLYTTAILKSKQVGLLIFSILLLMYTFIFTIIQLQDYALLIGSLGMFSILSVVMYFSRKIDWYSIKLGNQNPPEPNHPPVITTVPPPPKNEE
ncbi:MAG: cell envelope integrity protein CreD [Chitinophagales bacterium]